MRLRAWIALSAALPACGLFTDLDDLAGVPAPAEDGSADAFTADGGADVSASGLLDASDAASSRYREAILADRPIAYWRMDRSDGSSLVVDETGHGNALVLQGTVTHGPGALSGDPDRAIVLDGMGGGAQATDPRPFDFGGQAPFTIELWVRHESFSTSDDYHQIINASTGTGNTAVGYVLYTSRDADRITLHRRGSDPASLISAAFPQGTFVHVAATYDGTMIRLWIDGVNRNELATTDSIAERSSAFTVGFHRDVASFPGALDELAVYDRALSVAEIARHIDAARSP